MEVFYSPKFEKSYKKLANKIKKKAEKKEKIFRQNPFDQRLETHKLKGPLKGFYSFSIDDKYRIVFEFTKNKERAYFHNIGDHEVYN